ncbi:5-(carboxyamino)imidazole ribonucleotide synthase [Bibersteinia trehalosi]|uniref:5-(carboxyamino)imidazole ribonucleotide synthase n=1 Tax=Bibersteinia trehalosi TaxID=47735 RepID=UPI0040458686
MTKTLLPNATIGIIGAGQLGKMLAQSAQKMGYRVAMFDPNATSCGFAVADWHTVADFNDADALLAFAKKVDVLTYEFENINGKILQTLHSQTNLPQGTTLLLTSQDRIKEKTWLASIDVPVVNFAEVQAVQDIENFAKSHGYPVIIKTARFGYDGKGQMKIDSHTELLAQQAEVEKLLQQPCIAEAFCPFEFEVSVMVARDQLGSVDYFPISQNEHCKGILFTSSAPAQLSTEQVANVQEYARKIAENGELVGVCGIEFFVKKDGALEVNELAPRPHNSGHYTMEACNVSQYDQHILAITGRALQPIYQHRPALMVNLLGQHIAELPMLFSQFPNAMFHLYNKGEAKKQRKMGHFTLLGSEQDKEKWLASLTDVKEKF